MDPEKRRKICWPDAKEDCLRGECEFCHAGRLLRADTIRRYANRTGQQRAWLFGTHNPNVEWK